VGFNYRKERIKFEKQMQENETRYRLAGMSDHQIVAMREFEEEQFRIRRIYKLHVVLEESAERPGPIERASAYDSYFQELCSCLDVTLDNLCPGASNQLTLRDKEILLLLSFGVTQAEIAQQMGLAQQNVSKHLKKIKKIFQRRV